MNRDRANDVDETTADRSPRLLCAYSPRWLSGPTPFRGLCATWPEDAARASNDTGEHRAIVV